MAPHRCKRTSHQPPIGILERTINDTPHTIAWVVWFNGLIEIHAWSRSLNGQIHWQCRCSSEQCDGITSSSKHQWHRPEASRIATSLLPTVYQHQHDVSHLCARFVASSQTSLNIDRCQPTNAIDRGCVSFRGIIVQVIPTLPMNSASWYRSDRCNWDNRCMT